MIKFFDAAARTQKSEHDFQIGLLNLTARPVASSGENTDQIVDDIVSKISFSFSAERDKWLLHYTEALDGYKVKSASQLQVSPSRIAKAKKTITAEQKEALMLAAKRIKQYHKQQLRKSGKDWSYTEADGTVLGQRVTPLNRVGLYVPGGKASYPSTVLMTAIPARVAGVKEIIMCVPTQKGQLDDMVLAAASIAGVDKVFTVGGAQAIAAMAYGTETIPLVDKIVGPGNRYVAAAKRKVSGIVAVDMEAGPSEILIVCDGKTHPDWIALDMLSQAEHDEDAQAILISTDKNFLDQVANSLKIIIQDLERSEIARKSIENRGALILVKDLQQAAEISNRIAPEHLELSVENPEALLPLIKHAGAIFMGKYTSEAIGDYVAGPSHVLPTSGTARFSSPLGVYDFQKRTSIIQCSAQSASTLGQLASVLAHSESLTAHARSAEARFKK